MRWYILNTYTYFVSRFYCIISLRIAQIIFSLSHFSVCRHHTPGHTDGVYVYTPISKHVIDEIMQLNFQINISLLVLLAGVRWPKEKGNRCQLPDGIEIDSGNLILTFFFFSFYFVQWDVCLTATVVFAGYFVAVVLLRIEKYICDVNVCGARCVGIHITSIGHLFAQAMLPFDEYFARHHLQSDEGLCE